MADSKNIGFCEVSFMNVGAKVKEYLEAKELSQSWLSARSGIPVVKLSLSLNGKRKITLSEYESICWALGLGVDTFLEPTPPIGAGPQ